MATIDAMKAADCSDAQIMAVVMAAHCEWRERRAARQLRSTNEANPATSLAPLTPLAPSDVAPLAPIAPPPQMGSGGLWKGIARKALGLAPVLGDNTRRVAMAILEHVNPGTGQCNPSIRGLAEKLAISERSVKRAVATLDRSGLIARRVHRGGARRNAYQPNWLALQEIADGWDAGMARRKGPTEIDRGQLWPLNGDNYGPRIRERIPDSTSELVVRKGAPPPSWREPQFMLPLTNPAPPGGPSMAKINQALADRRAEQGTGPPQHKAARG